MIIGQTIKLEHDGHAALTSSLSDVCMHATSSCPHLRQLWCHCNQQVRPDTTPCLQLQAMGRLQTTCNTVSLVNHAAYTLCNRYLKAHAEAWMSFRYTADRQAGVLVPPQFVHMVGHGEEWVRAVRKVRDLAAGAHEHQDLAPHELDAEQSSETESEAYSEEESIDVSNYLEELPEYQLGDAYT